MKRIAIPLILLCHSFAFEGKVVRVADGDTLTLLTSTKETARIRLFGIDAPEKRQPFGRKSQEHLAQLCAGEMAKVEEKNTDRYGRIVGVVECRGIEANRAQVAEGLAWAYIQYSKAYTKEEREAKALKKGLWSEPNPTAPWDYRKAQRESKKGNR